MKLRRFAIMVLALCAPSLFGATAIGPVVNNGTINYGKNQVTLNGSGFEPAKAAPVLCLRGATEQIWESSHICSIAPQTP